MMCSECSSPLVWRVVHLFPPIGDITVAYCEVCDDFA